MADITADFLKGTGDIQNGSEICITIDFSKIDPKEYGKIENLKGSIPLILKMGEYPLPKWFHLSKEVKEKFIKDSVKKYSHLMEDKDKDEVKSMLISNILGIVFAFPEIDPLSKDFELLTNVFNSFNVTDNIVDDGDLSEKASKSNIQSKYLKIVNEYKDFNEVNDFTPYEKIARKFPIVGQNIKLLGQSFFEFDKYYPGFYSHLNPFRRYVEPVEAWTTILTKYCSNDPNGPYSHMASLYLSGFTSGMNFIDAIVYIYDCVLPEYVKSSLHFKILDSSIHLASRLQNELFGLQKDILKDKSKYFESLILKNVIEEDETLEDSIKFTFKQLKYLIRDIKIAQHQLEILFPEQIQKIRKFSQICNFVFDGTCYMYVVLTTQMDHPYGKLSLKIEKK